MTYSCPPPNPLPHPSVAPLHHAIRHAVKDHLRPRPFRGAGHGAAGTAGSSAGVQTGVHAGGQTGVQAACHLGVKLAAIGLLVMIPPVHNGPPHDAAMTSPEAALPAARVAALSPGDLSRGDGAAGATGDQPAGAVIAGPFPTGSALLYDDDPAADAADRDDPMSVGHHGPALWRMGDSPPAARPPVVTHRLETTDIPEPATAAMLGIAVALLGVVLRARPSPDAGFGVASRGAIWPAGRFPRTGPDAGWHPAPQRPPLAEMPDPGLE